MTTIQTNARNLRLPAGVTYTPRNGGLYVRWDGRPEGAISVTSSRNVAYGLVDDEGYDDHDFCWLGTPYQGADGRCRRSEVMRLAAEYLG